VSPRMLEEQVCFTKGEIVSGYDILLHKTKKLRGYSREVRMKVYACFII
jgi:hypothetical protein